MRNLFGRTQLIALAIAGVALAQQGGRARALHADALVFDGHVHAIDREFYHGGDIGERKADGMWDLSRAKEGGLKALFFSAYVPEDYYPGRLETRQALRQIDFALGQIA
jgi:membrane dipeptidase